MSSPAQVVELVEVVEEVVEVDEEVQEDDHWKFLPAGTPCAKCYWQQEMCEFCYKIRWAEEKEEEEIENDIFDPCACGKKAWDTTDGISVCKDCYWND